MYFTSSFGNNYTTTLRWKWRQEIESCFAITKWKHDNWKKFGTGRKTLRGKFTYFGHELIHLSSKNPKLNLLVRSWYSVYIASQSQQFPFKHNPKIDYPENVFPDVLDYGLFYNVILSTSSKYVESYKLLIMIIHLL